MSRKKMDRLSASPPGPRLAGVFELEDLFVDPGWMRRGIATALVGQHRGCRAGAGCGSGWK